jgi:hypothetical protein
MKVACLAVCVAGIGTAFAEPIPPAAEVMADWAAFSKPVHLSSAKTDRGEFLQCGEPVWVFAYSAKKETFSSYLIGVYKAGSLWGKDRAKTEARIEQQAEKAKAIKGDLTKGMQRDLAKDMQIVSKPDGRKIFFTALSYGLGGVTLAGFSRIGSYDILLVHAVDFGDDMPSEKRLEDAAKPTNDLPSIFEQLEQYLLKAK